MQRLWNDVHQLCINKTIQPLNDSCHRNNSCHVCCCSTESFVITPHYVVIVISVEKTFINAHM